MERKNEILSVIVNAAARITRNLFVYVEDITYTAGRTSHLVYTVPYRMQVRSDR
jgi:hypothetical protein